MGDVLAAAGNLTLRFRVAVEFAYGEVATADIAQICGRAVRRSGSGTSYVDRPMAAS